MSHSKDVENRLEHRDTKKGTRKEWSYEASLEGKTLSMPLPLEHYLDNNYEK